ncbi:MAG TPA: SDR family NAD(P)-dependent oxidoreductase [Bryobacteraceae bacterium]|nr:SDR family NAD(P)-dependent oxidoreductase [Bryobacteraceae bacterium]
MSNVLITGGTSGIGRGLAERYLAEGNAVMITGRDPQRLRDTATALPGLMTSVCDIGKPGDREKLARDVETSMPELHVAINNAGIQRRISLAADTAPWSERQAEIDILLSGPIHLNYLLIPIMLRHGQTARIVNVTSGGAIIPQVFAPVYSACKAALHSYTLTLRHALRGTGVRVVEVMPPAVQTALVGAGQAHGAPLGEFCDTVYAALKGDGETIGFGPTEAPEFKRLLAESETLFQSRLTRFPVATYSEPNSR